MSKKETIKFEGKDYHFVAKKWDVRKSLRIKQKLAPIMLTGFDAFQKLLLVVVRISMPLLIYLTKKCSKMKMQCGT